MSRCQCVSATVTSDSDLCCDWLFPGAVEIPSYLVGCFAMDRIGRKKTCAPALILAGVACMLIIVVPAVRTESLSVCLRDNMCICVRILSVSILKSIIIHVVAYLDASSALLFLCGYKTTGSNAIFSVSMMKIMKMSYKILLKTTYLTPYCNIGLF